MYRRILAVLILCNIFIAFFFSAALGQNPQAPFCFPTQGTLGYRYLEKIRGSIEPHRGIDIWTGVGWDAQGHYIGNNPDPPGNPIFLPYPGVLRAVIKNTTKTTIQGFIFRHQIDSSYSSMVPELGVDTLYMHMANDVTGESYVNSELIDKNKIGKQFPAGYFLGYQGNQRWDANSIEDKITHLHFGIYYVKDDPPPVVRRRYWRDPGPYLGYQLNVKKPHTLQKGFVFSETCIIINLPKTGQTMCFDTFGNEIACAGTGQDGEIRAGIAWPNPRFLDNGNGTLTDRLTGLMWLKDANCFGEQSWFSALDKIGDFNIYPGSYSCLDYTATYPDWRLPNINEIESLINPEAQNPSVWLNSQGFVNVQYDWYWSSTTRAYTANMGPDVDSAWNISMMVGWINSMTKGPGPGGIYSWPVRAGQFNSVDINYPANIWKTGQKTSYYPGDDGELQAGVSWPSDRFSNNGDGTVLDNLTGLVWTINGSTPVVDVCPVGTMTWQQALDHVACLNVNSYLGYSDWRLPNRKELFSLIDYSQYYPALPPGHPFINLLTDPNSQYWASTSSGAYGNGVAWLEDIKNEGGIGGTWKTNEFSYNYQVWPVRGGLKE